MPSRLEAGFARRFRDLLALVRPRRLEFGVELLMGRARERSAREGVALARAFAGVYSQTRARVARRLVVTGACSLAPAPWDRFRGIPPPAFRCDGSLGGLARWLRAAGYAAKVEQRPADAVACAAAPAGSVLLTSECDVLERKLVREGRLLALWVPSGLSPTEQLGLVLGDLGLPPRAPRCMSCGGVLVPVRKADIAASIPPRTRLWKDDYFLCDGCHKLFWEGTHWERISRAVAGAVAS